VIVRRWDALDRERMNTLVEREVFHAAHLTVARLHLAAGAVVPEHSHPNEQITCLLEGKLKFVSAGREIVISAGDMLEIPPHEPHRVEALEDSVAMDLFSPVREDWIRGDDAYLRK
jgi:quercetin dioxygenase-like cupin family protein